MLYLLANQTAQINILVCQSDNSKPDLKIVVCLLETETSLRKCFGSIENIMDILYFTNKENHINAVEKYYTIEKQRMVSKLIKRAQFM